MDQPQNRVPPNFALPFTAEYARRLPSTCVFQARAGHSESQHTRPSSPAYSTTAVIGDKPLDTMNRPMIDLHEKFRSGDLSSHQHDTASFVLRWAGPESQKQHSQARDVSESSDVGTADTREKHAVSRDLSSTTTTDGSQPLSRQMSLDHTNVHFLGRKRSLGSGYTSSYGGSALTNVCNRSADGNLNGSEFDDAGSHGFRALGIFSSGAHALNNKAAANNSMASACGVGQSESGDAVKDVGRRGDITACGPSHLEPSNKNPGCAVVEPLFDRDSSHSKLGDLFGGDYNVRLLHVAANHHRQASGPELTDTTASELDNSRRCSDASVIRRFCNAPDASGMDRHLQKPDCSALPPTPRLPHTQTFDGCTSADAIAARQGGGTFEEDAAAADATHSPSTWSWEVNPQATGHQLLCEKHDSSDLSAGTSNLPQTPPKHHRRNLDRSLKGLYIPTRPLQALGPVFTRSDQASFPATSIKPAYVELCVRVRRRQVSGRYLYAHVRFHSNSECRLPWTAGLLNSSIETLAPVQAAVDDEAVLHQLRDQYYLLLLGSNALSRAWRRYFSLKKARRMAIVPNSESNGSSLDEHLESGLSAQCGALSAHSLFAGFLDPAQGRAQTTLISRLRHIAAEASGKVYADDLGRIVKLPVALELVEDWSIGRVSALVALAFIAAVIATVVWVVWGPAVPLLASSGAQEATQRVVGGILLGVMVLIGSGGAIVLWTFVSWATM